MWHKALELLVKILGTNSCCWRTIWLCKTFLTCQSQVLKWCPRLQYLRERQNSARLEHICQIGNNSCLPCFKKNKVRIKTGSQWYAGSILQRIELSSHSPIPGIATSSSSFPSIIKNDIGKRKHSLDLNASREFVGLKIWIAWTLDWANSEKISTWTLDGVGKFCLDFALTQTTVF